MQSNTLFEFDAVCLGAVGLTAAWRRHKADVTKRYAPMLVISQTSCADDGVFFPAADVTVTTVDGLLALRAAIDEALRHDMPPNAGIHRAAEGRPVEWLVMQGG